MTKNPNQSLKQTGRADATVEHFFFAGVFRGSMVFWSAPSGSLALRYMRMFSIIFTLVIISRVGVAQETLPTPGAIHEHLDQILERPEGWPGLQTAESTCNEFHIYVHKLLKPNGEVREDIEDDKIEYLETFKIGYLELFAIILAEHYQLRGLGPDVVVAKYGNPKYIHQIRDDSDVFSVWRGMELLRFPTVDGGAKLVTNYDAMECYEYNDSYIWFLKGKILAVTPRSPRYDQYINNMDPFNQHDN